MRSRQLLRGVIVGCLMKLKLNKIRTDSAIDLQQWHSITMVETKQLDSAEAGKTPRKDSVRLMKDLEETVARNDAKVQEAMTDKRAGLVGSHCRKGGSVLWPLVRCKNCPSSCPKMTWTVSTSC